MNCEINQLGPKFLKLQGRFQGIETHTAGVFDAQQENWVTEMEETQAKRKVLQIAHLLGLSGGQFHLQSKS
ncbi:MAG TPA: hypothetical protein VNY97_04630, partial [Candidatus Angelobacter sp.]|nr:hypothetical protein [Candidatus Angelobacter sp.]